jgi:(p)ppGpp synthase/HD superfamily hydrolase
MSSLGRAISIAALAHERQKDKGGAPYILHPLRIMLAMSTDEERIVAVLHDVIEDTPWTVEALRAEGFTSVVVDAIECLTRRAGETYDDFIMRSRSNPISRRVKQADLVDNSDISRIPNPSNEDRECILKYKKAIAKLTEVDSEPAR